MGNGLVLDEAIYGFYVRNAGRSVATGVRFQIIKLEYTKGLPENFSGMSAHAYDLALYKGAGRPSEDIQAVLVPGASVLVHLATWREDYDVIFPAVSGLPDYYEDICTLATEYRFTVVAFDDKARFVQKVLRIKA